MAEVLTLRVRGEGGAEWDMDVPSGGHARERFVEQLTRGQLFVLDGDQALSVAAALELIGDAPEPTATAPTASDTELPSPDETGSDDGEPVVADGRPPKVGAGSGKAEWAAFAATKGIDPTGKNRAELIAAVEALDTQS